MKRWIAIYLIILVCIMLVACRNSKHESQYIAVGQLKITNEYTSFKNNVKNGAKVKGLDKLKDFLDKSAKGKKSSLILVYIDKDGKLIRSKLMYEKKMYKYFNSYIGYQVKEGRYKCKDIKAERLVMLKGCKGKKDSLLLFPLKQKQFEKNF